MKLHDLQPAAGAKKVRKRVGRGDSSGWGQTCGRGMKGQKSRSGSTSRPYFEGGQIPFFRRLPKRGFKNPSHVYYNVVNIDTLEEIFAGSENTVVDINLLREKGVVGKNKNGLKILARGEIKTSLNVKADKFSEVAKSKIEAAGGKCETLST